MSVFGRSYGQKISGQALMHGKPADVSSISKAMDAGIAYVTEDRKTYGLVLIDDIKGNVSLANLDASPSIPSWTRSGRSSSRTSTARTSTSAARACSSRP